MRRLRFAILPLFIAAFALCYGLSARASYTVTTTLPGTPQLTAISALTQALTTSPTTLTVPSGTKYLLIQPNPANTQTITLKGVSGDTGVLLGRNVDTLVSIDQTSPPASVVVVAGGSITVGVSWIQ